MRRLDKIIENLIEGAIFCSVRKRPGAIIEMLSKDDREILKEAKAKDFYHRIGGEHGQRGR